MSVDWPAQLLEHESASILTAGDLTLNPLATGLWTFVMAGLRVRMGINTGALCTTASQALLRIEGWSLRRAYLQRAITFNVNIKACPSQTLIPIISTRPISIQAV